MDRGRTGADTARIGESREELGSLAFRCGCAGILYVAYAIDEVDHVVFIRRFALVKA